MEYEWNTGCVVQVPLTVWLIMRVLILLYIFEHVRQRVLEIARVRCVVALKPKLSLTILSLSTAACGLLARRRMLQVSPSYTVLPESQTVSGNTAVCTLIAPPSVTTTLMNRDMEGK